MPPADTKTDPKNQGKPTGATPAPATPNLPTVASGTPLDNLRHVGIVVAEAGGMQFTRERALQIPVLKQVDFQPSFIRVEGAPFKSDIPTKNDKDGKPLMEPAMVFQVTDLTVGALRVMIANAAIISTIERMYPDKGYIGKCFEITSIGKKAGESGRQVRQYEIYEISVKAKPVEPVRVESTEIPPGA